MAASLAPALRMAAGAALLLVLLSPLAAAQVPDLTPPQPLAFSVVCREGHLEMNWLAAGQARCEVQDLSTDSTGAVTPGSSQGAQCHTVEFLPPTIDPPDAKGWVMDLPSPLCLFGNERRAFDVNVKNTPQVTSQQVTFNLTAVFTGPDGQKINGTVPIVAEVNRYDNVVVSLARVSKEADQDEVVRYEVLVTNLGLYPDVFTFKASSEDDIQVTAPPALYVPPGETRSANVSVLTPHSKLVELGRSTTIPIQVISTEGSFRYTTTGVLKIQGAYVPSFWPPLLALMAVSGAVLARDQRQRAQMRRLERGLPRRVEPTPRQAALLKDLRRRDPDAWKERQTKMQAIYAARRSRYKDERKVVVARDREEAKAARAEYKAAVLKRKEERSRDRARRQAERKAAKAQARLDRKAAKAQGKVDRKAAKRQAKTDKRAAKADAKERKRLGKELEKKRKVLDAQKAKLAKAEAKAAKAAAKGKGRDGNA